jgi:hypothetical protein
MATLTNQFLRENKVNDKFQCVVNHFGNEMVITNITDKNIMLKQISKLHRGNCGRFNSGIYRVVNDENATEWYLKNRVIQ